jgi:hypothetical protein
MVGGPAEIRCSLADPRIEESSGIAAASSTDEVVYTHNDSGDQPRFFAIDTRTCATRATFQVTGARNLDWEDMAAGVAADGTPVLWLADIGDNAARRATVVVYEVDEPGADASGGSVRPRQRWTLTYPDGVHDAETLLVDPETGRPVIITKDTTTGRSAAYRLPASGSGVLERLVGLDVRALPGGGLASPAWSLTGGATSPDRTTVALRSYLGAWLWTTTPGEPLSATLARRPEILTLPVGRQAEALTFTRDGTGIWVTSEGPASPLARIPLTPTPLGPSSNDPTESLDPETNDPIPPRSQVTLVLLAAAATLALTSLFLVVRHRRKP